ncbi:MAG: 4'-phosphopantetheinyl transferase family protein [Bacillota bacterium]
MWYLRNANIPAGEVHVWHAKLDLTAWNLADQRAILSPDEQQRADRFHHSVDKARYTIAHGLLRILLSSYAGCDPARLRFRSTRSGKPALCEPQSATRFHFSISHSGDLFTCAVTSGGEIGIDIEQVRSDIDFDAIARRFFSLKEAALLNRLHAQEKEDTFFALWTCKEAIAKALGTGLSLELGDCDVALPPTAGTVTVCTGHSKWHLMRVPLAVGYAAAIAVASESSDLRVHHFEVHPSSVDPYPRP